ncbi:MAG TPA: Gfo/Idh/MocA family oxidoreductase [Actinophytocola sp.]|uniref:Gfo/Idh/MocA family protein n=1 Tax=Actinophytocola sp. TaxID=1872138 RepID=UPI002DDD9390|nr:Gfo/Idh/MocA family oxidoreductase [Actinophytocola sp.]HEV2782481.1 Gfo/Idh/MocA family oxidoreductase [Actinophytocola sp.]
MAERGDAPLRVGLVGAGPWARALHAPSINAHPRTKLAAVWARRENAAAALAAPYGATVARSFKELMSTADAISFAVPPAVQAPLAIHAAQAGRHLILEKPIAATAEEAERLVAAADEAAVATVVVLTRRFATSTIEWLDEVHRLGGWTGGTARWLSNALLDSPYAASPWRHEGGALADVGPHVLDLLDAALGEITGVLAAYRGEPDLWQIVLGHANGAISTACMSMRLPVRPGISEASVFGTHGYLELPQRAESAQDCFHRLLDDFVTMVHNGQTEHRCDVSRGLHIQRLVQTIGYLVGPGHIRLSPELGRQPG